AQNCTPPRRSSSQSQSVCSSSTTSSRDGVTARHKADECHRRRRAARSQTIEENGVRFPEYEDFDGIGLAKLVSSGDVSAGELLEAAIDRVEAYDGRINAVVRKAYAYGKDQIGAGLPIGPFTGVPFLVKDHGLDIAGVSCADGSAFRSDRPATVD